MVFKKGWQKEAKEKKEKEAKTVEVLTPNVPASPIHKAFYIEKEKGKWRLIVVDLQDDKVTAKKIRECDNKSHSLEAFKITFAELYYFGK